MVHMFCDYNVCLVHSWSILITKNKLGKICEMGAAHHLWSNNLCEFVHTTSKQTSFSGQNLIKKHIIFCCFLAVAGWSLQAPSITFLAWIGQELGFMYILLENVFN